MGKLSQRLQDFYTHSGNKILFQNGLTLNQMAWEMWERLSYSAIDPSALSRVLAGKRTFTPRQLEVFCQILCLTPHQTESLHEVLHQEINLRFGI